MIRESEIKNCISHEIPALSVELSHIKDNNDVYRALDCLTAYTKQLIREDRLLEVEACFETAHYLLHEGNRMIQLAVENTFIYSISSLLEVSLNAAQSVRHSFLQNFKTEYCRQINSQLP